MSNRIVLLDNWGEELFSGLSLFLFPPPAASGPVPSFRFEEPVEEEDEPIPPTLRSSVFVRYDAQDETLHVSEFAPEDEPQTVRESSRVIAAVARVSEVDLKELHDHVGGEVSNDDHRAA